jgi:hypothetical protein
VIGKLLQQARIDARKMATAGGFEDDIILKTKDGSIELAVKGLTTSHTQQYDTEGNPVNSKSEHITVSELDLIEGEFPYKSTKGSPNLNGCKVVKKDNTGETKNHVIKETMPNKTTGLIVCILGDA